MTDLAALLIQYQHRLAEQIYVEVYGDADDKYAHATCITEIEEWLADGDPGPYTFTELVVLWQEYVAEEAEA